MKASKCVVCKECKLKSFSKPHPSVKKMLNAAFVVCPCGKEILHQQMKSHVLNCDTFDKSITSLLHGSSEKNKSQDEDSEGHWADKVEVDSDRHGLWQPQKMR